jgi:peptidyl-prolyl cis-trans isomerase A (cyclophilin A)
MNKRDLPAALALALLAACSSPAPKTEAPRREPVNERAPDVYKVRLNTSRGGVLLEVHRQWAPNGADRFYNLVKTGFYDGAKFFRVLYNFVAQFGLKGDPAVDRIWADAIIADDPVKESNRKGTITFAKAGPNSRTTQVFINLRDNTQLDGQGFAPFGRVIEGMDTVESLYKGYGDAPPGGSGPDQTRLRMQGNEYLERDFPRLDGITKAVIEQ